MAGDVVAGSAHADARTLLVSYWDPRRGAITCAALGVVVRFWLLGSGWFHDSDHVLRIRGWELPFTTDYLLQAPVPGITPGLAALQWPLSRAWPMNFTPQSLVLIALQCLVVLLGTRLMLRLWPRSWWTLVPVAILAFSPLTLPQSAWWTSGVPTSLTQVSLLLFLLAGTTWWRRGSVVPLVLATVAWVLVCPFGDLALLVPVLAVLVLPYLDAGQSRRSPRAFGALIGTATALVVAAVVTRILLVPPAYPGRPQAEDWANAVGRAMSDGVGALVGGPLAWAPLAPETPITNPPLWWTIAALQVVLVLVVTSSALSRRALVLWAWAFTWLLLTVAQVLLSSPVPSSAGLSIQTLRVTAAAGLPLVLALGLSLEVLRQPTRRGMAHLRGAVRVPALASPVLAVTAVCGVVVASLVSLSGYRAIWSANEGRGYVAGATYSLATAAEGPALLDQAVPPSVLSPLSAPYHLVGHFLAPLQPRPDIGDVTTQLRVLAPDGTLRQGVVNGVASTKGPVPGCGWLLRDSGSVPLSAPVPDFVHTLRITYFASGEGTATVSFGDAPGVLVPISRGLGEVDLNLFGGGNAVRIAGITTGVSVCTDDVTVGVPVVAP